MTTNAGAFEGGKESIGFSRSSSTHDSDGAMEAINKQFSPEFRNRLDAIVMFNAVELLGYFFIVNKELDYYTYIITV